MTSDCFNSMKMVSYLENKMIHDLIQGEKADLTQLKPKLNQKKS